jgi:hypothetical protein
MATWTDVVSYIRGNYRVQEVQENSIRMLFDLGDLRSQLVFIWHQSLLDGKEEWIQIESPIGPLDKIDLARAMKEVAHLVCGGLASTGEFLVNRHAVPLANLDINELERPLILVTATADRLEQSLVGGDSY